MSVDISELVENVCKSVWKDETGKYLCCVKKDCKYIVEKDVIYRTNHIMGIEVPEHEVEHKYVCGVYKK